MDTEEEPIIGSVLSRSIRAATKGRGRNSAAPRHQDRRGGAASQAYFGRNSFVNSRLMSEGALGRSRFSLRSFTVDCMDSSVVTPNGWPASFLNILSCPTLIAVS